jgi:hypothetical protein
MKQQPTWGTCPVQSLKEDETIIKKIKDLFPRDEVFRPGLFSTFFMFCPRNFS